MKRPSYKEAIAWIALNDSIADYETLEDFQAAHLISVVLVADLFGKESEDVAKAVWLFSQKN